MPPPVFINGRFLVQPLSGVQRYAREIVKALDRLIVEGVDDWQARSWRLLTPPGVDCDLALQRIEVVPCGRGSGHLWEQTFLPIAARGGRLLNLGNSAPLLHPKALMVLHDVAVFRTPHNYSTRYALAHQSLERVLTRVARVATVSEFSRAEIADVLGIDASKIIVAPNGYEHLEAIAGDPRITARLGLGAEPYFLFVGSPTHNKNLSTLLAAFSRLQGEPRAKLVLVGSLANSVFGQTLELGGEGVVLAGRLRDDEVAALYSQACALVFPSLYEGFGIPPLEAMVRGCPVIASDIPVLREVCGDAATYFQPLDVDGLARALTHQIQRAHSGLPVQKPTDRHLKFSWRESARILGAALVR